MLLPVHHAPEVMFAVLSPGRAMAYAGAILITFSLLWLMLWRLPILAYFRKPVDLSHECPMCGSKDVRPSHITTITDRFRRHLGLQPFRCRGCTKRFISRSSALTHHHLSPEAEVETN